MSKNIFHKKHHSAFNNWHPFQLFSFTMILNLVNDRSPPLSSKRERFLFRGSAPSPSKAFLTVTSFSQVKQETICSEVLFEILALTTLEKNHLKKVTF